MPRDKARREKLLSHATVNASNLIRLQARGTYNTTKFDTASSYEHKQGYRERSSRDCWNMANPLVLILSIRCAGSIFSPSTLQCHPLVEGTQQYLSPASLGFAARMS
jgi:hypothetical protein